MDIHYKKGKENSCYESFVKNPEDIKVRRAFLRLYGNIANEAVKLHKRLLSFATVAEYNAVWGSTDNRIEIKHGQSHKNPMIFKTRVTSSYRKFFYHELENGLFKLVKDWTNNFSSISTIFVIGVTNHDYNVS